MKFCSSKLRGGLFQFAKTKSSESESIYTLESGYLGADETYTVTGFVFGSAAVLLLGGLFLTAASAGGAN